MWIRWVDSCEYQRWCFSEDFHRPICYVRPNRWWVGCTGCCLTWCFRQDCDWRGRGEAAFKRETDLWLHAAVLPNLWTSHVHALAVVESWTVHKTMAITEQKRTIVRVMYSHAHSRTLHEQVDVGQLSDRSSLTKQFWRDSQTNQAEESQAKQSPGKQTQPHNSEEKVIEA